MNKHRFDAHIREIIKEEDIPLPASVAERTERTLAALPQCAPKRTLRPARLAASAAACIAVLFLVIIPNISVAYARAVEDIPVIGALVRVMTIRNYFYQDEGHELDAKIPQIIDSEHKDASERINRDIDSLTEEMIRQFCDDLEISDGKSFGSAYIDYEIMTNSEQWFTLKLTTTEVFASSAASFRYYHIDCTTGDYVTFGDLFRTEDFPQLEELITGQMREQMARNPDVSYWLGDSEAGRDAAALDQKQNFYFRDNGDLVIVYDKYEVGPGYMGCPEFTIPFEEYQEIIGAHFRDLLRPDL